MAIPRKLCLVTGSTAGIGFEIALGLARAGCRVVLACRDRVKGEAAGNKIAAEAGNSGLDLLLVDLASQRSIRDAAQEFSKRYDALDVLVNNAGAGVLSPQDSPDGIELTFATNVLGYFLLTNLLLESLRRAEAARVVNLASLMAYGLDLGDVEFKRRPYDPSAAYAQSKQADRMLTWAFARRFEGISVTANAMHPGVVDTNLLRSLAPGISGRSPAEGADTAVWLSTSPEVAGLNGRFVDQAQFAAIALDGDVALQRSARSHRALVGHKDVLGSALDTSNGAVVIGHFAGCVLSGSHVRYAALAVADLAGPGLVGGCGECDAEQSGKRENEKFPHVPSLGVNRGAPSTCGMLGSVKCYMAVACGEWGVEKGSARACGADRSGDLSHGARHRSGELCYRSRDRSGERGYAVRMDSDLSAPLIAA